MPQRWPHPTEPNPNVPPVRTVQVTAPWGTVMHYMCTFHRWMQGEIDVQ
jgi:hypothetical protein